MRLIHWLAGLLTWSAMRLAVLLPVEAFSNYDEYSQCLFQILYFRAMPVVLNLLNVFPTTPNFRQRTIRPQWIQWMGHSTMVPHSMTNRNRLRNPSRLIGLACSRVIRRSLCIRCIRRTASRTIRNRCTGFRRAIASGERTCHSR